MLLSAFYVAPGGSNSADGSAQHPWATISHAGAEVAPGDTVHVAPGTYNENVYLSVSGTSSAPITFISDVPWGAKIRSTTSIFALETHGNYVTIQGFDVSGNAANVWDGIECYGSNCNIIGNYVHDIPATTSGGNGGSGIDTSGNYYSTDINTIGNVVGNIGSPGTDCEGIFYAMNGGNCYNNIVYNCAKEGIGIWHAGQHINISNNLCFNNATSGICVGTGDSASKGSSGDYNVVTNNICYDNNIGIFEENLPSTDTHDTYLNNCSYNNGTNWSLEWNSESGAVTADPQFVNFQLNGSGPWAGGTANYQLAAGSPCIGAGTSVDMPATDFNGVARPADGPYDIGPCQFTSSDTTPPTVISETPGNNGTGVSVSTSCVFTFSEPIQSSTINFTLKSAANSVVTTSLSYDPATNTATLTPTASLAYSTTYTATVSGATDMAGNVMTAPVSETFTTASAPPAAITNATIWSSTATPAILSATDSKAVELGVKFRSDVNGYITGIRFYKGSGNTGTHVGHLWTSTGTLLATATFSKETASGWQQVNFATPVAITANTTYIVSYYAPAGHYAYNLNYFASSGIDNGVLHALSNSAGGGDGVYLYASGGGFPTSTYEASNYWVDVVFNSALTNATIGDPGFEQVVVGAGHFQYDPPGSPWAFSGSSGISGNNSGFTSGNPPAPQGSQVAFLQETGSFTQTVADWAAGSYVLTFDAAQRGNYGVSGQNFNVLIDGNIVGTFTPSGTSYQSYSTAVFTVTTAGLLTITFQGLDSAGGDNTAFIDGVSVS